MLFLNIQNQNNKCLPQETERVPDETGWWKNLNYVWQATNLCNKKYV